MKVLCLSPTRELAVQIQKVVLALGDYMNVQEKLHAKDKDCLGREMLLTSFEINVNLQFLSYFSKKLFFKTNFVSC